MHNDSDDLAFNGMFANDYIATSAKQAGDMHTICHLMFFLMDKMIQIQFG